MSTYTYWAGPKDGAIADASKRAIIIVDGNEQHLYLRHTTKPLFIHIAFTTDDVQNTQGK